MESPQPKRKHPRLKEYDYSQNGCYFVTSCTNNRQEILCRIAVGRGDLTPPSTELTPWGKTVEKYIFGIEKAYPHISVDHYVIMPNHVHLLLRIDSDDRRALLAPYDFEGHPTDEGVHYEAVRYGNLAKIVL